MECRRQGHDVEVYEAFPALKVLGDIITFGSNAGRIFARWSDKAVTKKFRTISHDTHSSGHGFDIHKWDTGEVVFHQPPMPYNPEAPYFSGHRGELHEIVFNYAKDDLGIPIHLNSRIEKYYEDDNEAGIILDGGEKASPPLLPSEVAWIVGANQTQQVSGDIVIAADGVRSKAREIVLGYEDKPKSSGYAIWRTWFTNEAMMADPDTRHFCENGDTFNGWIGADIHFLFTTIKNGSDCCWVLTHKDDHDIDESWSFPGKLSEVLEAIKEWDPMVTKIISKTPEDKLVDWKLVYRDPLPTWVSPKGRTLLLGDSAHPFLPTSAQGAAQAVEDAASIAACLRLGGKGDIPKAVRAHERIRCDRVREVQKTGETTRDLWHKVDWDAVKKDPKIIQFPRHEWILNHDAEKHAVEVYDEVTAQLAKNPAA